MIRSYFNKTADEVKKKTGAGGYGEGEFETLGYDVDCRKKEQTRLVRNNDGNEVVSSIEVWLPPEFERLPAGSEIIFNEEAETVIKSGYVPGISEDQYLRVFLE
jgi:hypothetical protein